MVRVIHSFDPCLLYKHLADLEVGMIGKEVSKANESSAGCRG